MNHLKILVLIIITSIGFVSKGQVFDLSNKIFDHNKSYLIDKGWKFYPNEFYSSKQIRSLKNVKGYRVNASESWYALYKTGILESNTGYGTYYTQIKLNKEYPRLLIKFDKTFSAAKFYVNGELYTSVGRVSESKLNYKPEIRPVLIEVDPSESEICDLVIHVSNFDHFEGGMASAPLIGNKKYINNVVDKKLISDSVVIGTFLITSIIFLFLYLLGKSGLEFIVFSIFSFVFTIQYSIYTSHIFSTFFQGINYHLYVKLGIFSLLITFSSFLLYIHFLFPNYSNKNITFTSSLVLAIGGLVAFVISPYYITMSMPALLLGFVPAVSLYLFYVFSKTIIFKEKNKLLTSLAALSLLLIAFHFINTKYNIIPSKLAINNVSFFLFLSIHIFLLMNKYSSKIKQLYLAVEESVRAKNEFISTMSHELRTPLNGIMGMATMLKSNELDSNKLSKIENIVLNTEKLTSIIDDILNLSDLESGTIQLKYNKINIREIINKSVELTNHFRKDKNIDLDILIDPQIEESLVGDELRIKQIFIHFLSNAFKFTQKGKVVVSGKLIKNNENIQEVLFSIADSGQGISKEKLTSLFNSFKQADGTHSRKHGGLGLGLALSQHLVNLMGGKINVQSELNKGTTFSFNLLLRKADNEIAIKENVVFRKLELDPTLKILVAEDNPVNQKLMLMMLKNLGYQADIAENGKIAVEKAMSNNYDIIFMDIQMPEMDGLQATQRILKNATDRPIIIAVTANATDRDRDECIEAGMNDFVAKPVKPIEIKDCIIKWQGLRGFLNENKIAI